MGIAAILSLASLLGWLYLAFFRAQFWRPLLAQPAVKPDAWPSVDIIVPARNEAELLPGSLPSLLAQDYPGNWRVILVNDHSTDGTAEIAKRMAHTKSVDDRLTVIDAPDLQPGWNGKLWALNAGLVQSKADYVLFTDADIYHPNNNLRELVARALENKLDLVSQMVHLHCEDFAEKLLIPAFVFFFSMLYPFRSANDPESEVAAAAGGVMLVKRLTLHNISDFASIRNNLIDDCALAHALKTNDAHIELTMAPEVKSLRDYPAIGDVWRMIARTAFFQLRYSTGLLIATVIGMTVLFVIPLILQCDTGTYAARLGFLSWLVMSILYLPTIRLYRLPFFWAIMLPAAAVIYIAATIDSARLYWQGKGGLWKGRTHA